MGLGKKICTFVSGCYDNYTWFSMVCMNGEEGDRRYKLYKLKKKTKK